MDRRLELVAEVVELLLFLAAVAVALVAEDGEHLLELLLVLTQQVQGL